MFQSWQFYQNLFNGLDSDKISIGRVSPQLSLSLMHDSEAYLVEMTLSTISKRGAIFPLHNVGKFSSDSFGM